MGRVVKKVIKKGSNSAKSNTTKVPKRKHVISLADRKRNKIKIEKLNKQTDLSVGTATELNESIRLSSSVETSNKSKNLRKQANALHAEKLMRDQAHDMEIQKQIERQKKDTEDSLLKQIESMSGFSL